MFKARSKPAPFCFAQKRKNLYYKCMGLCPVGNREKKIFYKAELYIMLYYLNNVSRVKLTENF